MKTYFVRKSRSFHTCDISRNEHWLIVHRCIRYLETQLIFIVERVISKEYRQLLFYRAILSSISFFFFLYNRTNGFEYKICESNIIKYPSKYVSFFLDKNYHIYHI